MTSEREIAAVIKLDGPQRVEYFVKKVADANAAWSLWRDGWAAMETNEGTGVFPLWPRREYADMCRSGVYADYVAKPIGNRCTKPRTFLVSIVSASWRA